MVTMHILGFLVAQTVKNLPKCRRPRFDPLVRKVLWRREWQPIPVSLFGESHGQKALVDYTIHGVAKSWTLSLSEV